MVSHVPTSPDPPATFQVARALRPGHYALREVFPGLDRSPAFRKYPGSPARRRKLAERTTVELARRKGEWMYVAPHSLPPDADANWRPLVTAEDCIVVSGEHLRKSSSMVLYLDILHELYHVLQRWDGRELWDEAYSYVDRPTELEAYAFAIREARRLGVSDLFLDDYLRVVWVSKKDHLRLLRNLGVRPD
jgi:hypothetical protein